MTRSFITVTALASLLMPMAAFATPANQSQIVLASNMAPSSVPAASSADMPYVLAKLQNQMQAQRDDIKTLENTVGQGQNGSPKVIYSTTIPTNLPAGG